MDAELRIYDSVMRFPKVHKVQNEKFKAKFGIQNRRVKQWIWIEYEEEKNEFLVKNQD